MDPVIAMKEAIEALNRLRYALRNNPHIAAALDDSLPDKEKEIGLLGQVEDMLRESYEMMI